MPTVTVPRAVPLAIRKALALLVAPGAVVELRILNTSRGTVSGYYDDLDTLARDAAQLNPRYGTTYITLNPPKPELLARSANHAKEWAKQTTGDSDIVRRLRLFIDADPKRSGGISSTDAEHAAALERIETIQACLTAEGWPAGITADSGNGGHLLHRIDLPNDAASTVLVSGVIDALAFRFSDSVVEVDRTTRNAGRICKLYGTVAMKGDSTPDRPHRLARIIDAPAELVCVTPEQLAAVAAWLPVAPALERRNGSTSTASLNLEAWISTHGLAAGPPAPWEKGHKWILSPCPWNPEHTNRSAYVVQFDNGAIAAGCHHNGCAGNGWHELRAMYEPERGTLALPAAPRNGHGPESAASPDSAPGAGVAAALPPFPVDVLPGEARRLVEEGAASLRCPADLVAVPMLAIVAGAMGNLYRLELKPGYTQRAILWMAVIAEPGTAKSPAQAITQTCLDRLQREAHERHAAEKRAHQRDVSAWQGADKGGRGKDGRGAKPEVPDEEEHFYSTDSTTEGVAKMLGGPGSVTPGFVIIRDELAGFVQSFDAYRAAKGGDRQTWLSMWAGMPFKSDRAGRDSVYVPEPAVSICGGIQPDLLPTLAAESGRRDGFVERFLFSYPDTQPMRWSDESVQDATRDAFTAVLHQLRRGDGGTISLAAEARSLYTGWVNENADKQEAISGALLGYYAKLPAQAARLALVLHCLRHPAQPACKPLSAQTMAAALQLTEYFRAHAHRALRHFGTAALVSHPLALRLLRVLGEAGGEWLRTATLYERLGGHVTAEAVQPALAELERIRLVEQRTIAASPQGGRPAIEWRGVRELTEETELTSFRAPLDGVNSDSSVNSQHPFSKVRACRECGTVLVGDSDCADCGDVEAF